MSVPCYTSQITPAVTDTIQVTGGSAQVLALAAVTPYYHLISAKTTTGAGRSLIYELTTLLSASMGLPMTVSINDDLKIRFGNSAGSAKTLTFDENLAWRLGFDTGLDRRVGTPFVSPSIAAGDFYSVPFRSVYLWCPHRRINRTGPKQFDPLTCAGVRTAASFSSRASDMTTTFVRNGVQVEAEHRFLGVEKYYRAHPDLSAANVHQREDAVTFWEYGASLGSRILYWRNFDDVAGSTNTAGSINNTPSLSYIEYYPNEEYNREPLVEPSAPPNLYYHDIRLGFWLTERGEQLYLS